MRRVFCWVWFGSGIVLMSCVVTLELVWGTWEPGMLLDIGGLLVLCWVLRETLKAQDQERELEQLIDLERRRLSKLEKEAADLNRQRDQETRE